MDTITREQPVELTCGCKRGFSLCPKAVELWNRVGIAYQAALDTDKWFPYNDFREQYEQHFEQ